MKVILLKDIARLGRRSEVKEVPAGHAINFLIPRKMAVIATPESMSRLTEEVKKHQEQKEHTQDNFREALKKLSELTVQYPVQANAQGHLFKGINADDIARQLQVEGIVIEKGAVILKHPIKELGIHEIVLKQGGVEGVCRLEIVKK